MERSQDSIARQDARQIVRIVRIECGQPLERVEALVFGETPCAAPLAEELERAGARVTRALLKEGERFDLILLLTGIEAGRLDFLTRPGALVIDACRQKNSEWAIYDPALHYRRIRVISTAGL